MCSLMPGGGYALPGLDFVAFVGPCKRSAAGRFYLRRNTVPLR